MKKPDETSDSDFSEFLWMAEDGADEGLQQQVEEEMELIEQDFLEAMFDELLREEDEQQVYYGPPDHLPSSQQRNSTASSSTSHSVSQQSKTSSISHSMQLPKIQSELNPNAPVFVPRCFPAPTAVSS